MKTFEVHFRKNGLKYQTFWKALSQIHCILEIEDTFTSPPDYESAYPQNAIMSIKEIEEE